MGISYFTAKRIGIPCEHSQSCVRTACRGCQTPGGSESHASCSSGVVCATAASFGSASWATSGEKENADLAAGRGRSATSDGQGGASGKTGDSKHGSSRQSTQ